MKNGSLFFFSCGCLSNKWLKSEWLSSFSLSLCIGRMQCLTCFVCTLNLWFIVYITNEGQICPSNTAEIKSFKNNTFHSLPCAYSAWQSQQKHRKSCLPNDYQCIWRYIKRWASAERNINTIWTQIYESTTNTHAHRALKGSSSSSRQNLGEKPAGHVYHIVYVKRYWNLDTS